MLWVGATGLHGVAVGGWGLRHVVALTNLLGQVVPLELVQVLNCPQVAGMETALVVTHGRIVQRARSQFGVRLVEKLDPSLCECGLLAAATPHTSRVHRRVCTTRDG